MRARLSSSRRCRRSGTIFHPSRHSSYPPLFRHCAEERAVRPAYGLHPRLAILGPLEARLQSFDVVVLGGLNEGTWPRRPRPIPGCRGPCARSWGFESPERAIGLAAHDFAMLAAGAARLPHARRSKSDGTPTVASRWLQRLLQLTKGSAFDAKLKADARLHCAWPRASSEPGEHAPEPRPAPKPPVAARPRSFRSPKSRHGCAIPMRSMRKHILQLKPLDPLDAEIGPLERGSAMHRASSDSCKDASRNIPDRCRTQRLVAIADDVFAMPGHSARGTRRYGGRASQRAARWFVELEANASGAPSRASFVEIRGAAEIQGSRRRVHVARPRRPHRCAAATAARRSSTTRPGSRRASKQVEALLAPQLPLEGAILARRRLCATSAQLDAAGTASISVSAAAPSRAKIVVSSDVREAGAPRRRTAACAAHRDFDPRHTPYLPRVDAVSRRRVGDYDHLARVREWSLCRMGARNERVDRRARSPPIRNVRPGFRPMPARARPTRSPTA